IAVVKDGETCENPDRIPVPVTVNPSATANDITIGDASVCIGDGVTLSPSSGIPDAVFRWYANADRTGEITTGVDVSGALILPAFSSAGTHTYYVSVSGTGYCENAAGELKAVEVTVSASPAAPVVTPPQQYAVVNQPTQ